MLSYNQLIERIHYGVDPYKDFKYTAADLDPQGWGSTHPIFESTIDKYNRHLPVTIFEIGSWKGGSARHMAGLLKKKSIDGAIVCIDTWLAEEVLWSCEWRESLKLKNGRPNVYQTFMANTIDAGLQNYIVPLSMPSFNAARYLTKVGLKADIIYVDGCHIEGAVLQDLKSYWPLLKKKGTMIIDDYHAEFEGLMKDVHTFAQHNDLPINNQNGKCVLWKP